MRSQYVSVLLSQSLVRVDIYATGLPRIFAKASVNLLSVVLKVPFHMAQPLWWEGQQADTPPPPPTPNTTAVASVPLKQMERCTY